MKKQCFLTVFTLLFFSIVYAQTSEKLNINTTKSELKWSGEYAFYFGGHNGFINFKEGYFIKNNKVIIGGEFIIDMHSITNTDIKTVKGKTSLEMHLKNKDFFEVEKFPISKLVITDVEYHNDHQMKIYADLTIKGITLPINFQAEADYKKEQLTTKFKIDRTRWGITFNSKEVEGKLKDGLISDAIEFDVKLSL